MSERRNRPRGRRPSVKPQTDEQELWGAVPSLARPEPIQLAPEPATLIESLGQPSLRGASSTVEHYVASVVQRAAGLAAALAASAQLLVEGDDDSA
jgi:hypothetical protein